MGKCSILLVITQFKLNQAIQMPLHHPILLPVVWFVPWGFYSKDLVPQMEYNLEYSFQKALS